ncbi:MAG TPA: SUMF1/EgtB/PvdO family nonheme iron enzyme [Tepidisphaeraceae bacterium]|nr:SUMF1/EgtB/PvdO family nonheme iron enzyme [Tepidisphaeraceae bacterium]
MIRHIAVTFSVLCATTIVVAQAPVSKPASQATPLPKVGEKFEEKIPGTLVRFEMTPIPAGKQKVASTQQSKDVEQDVKPIWIAKTEVTWDLYDIWLFQLDLTEKEKAASADAKSRPSKPYGAPDRGFGHQGYPALAMTDRSARNFCEWLSKKTGKKYRLPTQAEWEYACRAGVGDADERKPLADRAWFVDNSDDKTHPVASKTPNSWGLYDMLGNVGEWVINVDGNPVVMGGSYTDESEEVGPSKFKTQKESWNVTDPQNPKSRWWLSDAWFVGFRVVCEP